MSIPSLARRSRAFSHAALLLAPLLLTVGLAAGGFLLPATPALAAPEDLEEVNRLELEGQKVDAFLLLKELAAKGNAEAQYKLAGYYHYGYAGPANFKEALGWYERAARQGNADAMLGLAILLDPANQTVKSIPDDPAKAFTWLSIAATRLEKPTEIAVVKGLRDKLKSELSTAELNAALNAAMVFQPVPEPQQ
jgi:hypothetical protein